jgi:uncharacterized protein with PIN domain
MICKKALDITKKQRDLEREEKIQREKQMKERNEEEQFALNYKVCPRCGGLLYIKEEKIQHYCETPFDNLVGISYRYKEIIYSCRVCNFNITKDIPLGMERKTIFGFGEYKLIC